MIESTSRPTVEQMDEIDLPSMEMLYSELRSELDLQHRHWEAMDAKAGLLLGFSAALIGLSVGESSFLWPGQATAIWCASLAFRVMDLRRIPLLNVPSARRKYPDKPEAFTLVKLFDARLTHWNEMNGLLSDKGEQLRWVSKALFAAIVIMAVGAMIPEIWR